MGKNICETCKDITCHNYSTRVEECLDYERMTNADCIRSMSDYDLADWIADILNHCDNKKPEDECLESCPLYKCCNDQPTDNIEGWLNAPAEEGER